MKSIFTYMAVVAALVLTACSDSDDFTSAGTNVSGSEESAIEGNYITMPVALHEENWQGNDVLSSKAQFYYDYVSGQATFSWKEGDFVGVYPVKYVDGSGEQQTYLKGNSTLTKWEIYSVTSSGNKSYGIFDENDDNILSHHRCSYIAVYPYITDDTDYSDIPITYEGQVQTASSKMHLYRTGAYDEYVESEKVACEHLTKYDYLVDTERAATETTGKIHFDMKRLGAVTRLFIKMPEKIVFDSLQVYNSAKEFTLATTLDASKGEYVAVPTKKSHVMSLQLNKFGFDYWKSAADDDNYYSASVGWTMQCYMMVAPIDLSAEETPNSVLYLIGREPHFYATAAEYNAAKGTTLSDDSFATLTKEQKMKVYETYTAFNTAKGLDGEDALTEEQFNALTPAQKMSEWTRKFYKAPNLVKKNMKAGALYQWTVTNAAADAPITFEEITIEQWKEGTTFTNESGTGTGDW